LYCCTRKASKLNTSLFAAPPGTQFACFPSTKVQILTPEFFFSLLLPVVYSAKPTYAHKSSDAPRLPPHVLRFTVAPAAHGEAVLTLVPRDSGGVANGGVDVGQPVFTSTRVPIWHIYWHKKYKY
jgi:hypothetical protein